MSEAWVPGEVDHFHEEEANEWWHDGSQAIGSHVHSQEVIDKSHATIDVLRDQVATLADDLARVTAERDDLQSANNQKPASESWQLPMALRKPDNRGG